MNDNGPHVTYAGAGDWQQLLHVENVWGTAVLFDLRAPRLPDGTLAGSAVTMDAAIRQMVAAEDTSRPLSDSALAQMLEEQGIQVARRTVAKYREMLGILPSSKRRKVY